SLASFISHLPRPPSSPPFPYTTLFRSRHLPRRWFVLPVLHLGPSGVGELKDAPPVCLRASHEPLVLELLKGGVHGARAGAPHPPDRKSTRLNSSHSQISYAVFCLKKKN